MSTISYFIRLGLGGAEKPEEEDHYILTKEIITQKSGKLSTFGG